MPTVSELTAVYGNFLLGPRRGPSVCERCFNFTDGYTRCYACAHAENWLDAICPISYSISLGQLHHALKGYKRFAGESARRLTVDLAAVLWRHLEIHEGCVAHAAGTTAFEFVTTVPPGDKHDARSHPLRQIVGELVGPTRARHEPLLERSGAEINGRAFDRKKYVTTRSLAAASVLLIDDTWTTGANAQSAGAALKGAGAGPVGAVVIGRYLNREWHENDRRLRGIARPFDWSSCALCGSAKPAD
jgi:hypothetical protein